MEALLNIEQAAQKLGLSPWTLRLYIAQKKLSVVRLGRRVLLEPSEIEAYVAQNRENGSNLE
jgi:excisionase family DNA binding protein